MAQTGLPLPQPTDLWLDCAFVRLPGDGRLVAAGVSYYVDVFPSLHHAKLRIARYDDGAVPDVAEVIELEADDVGIDASQMPCVQLLARPSGELDLFYVKRGGVLNHRVSRDAGATWTAAETIDTPTFTYTYPDGRTATCDTTAVQQVMALHLAQNCYLLVLAAIHETLPPTVPGGSDGVNRTYSGQLFRIGRRDTTTPDSYVWSDPPQFVPSDTHPPVGSTFTSPEAHPITMVVPAGNAGRLIAWPDGRIVEAPPHGWASASRGYAIDMITLSAPPYRWGQRLRRYDPTADYTDPFAKWPNVRVTPLNTDPGYSDALIHDGPTQVGAVGRVCERRDGVLEFLHPTEPDTALRFHRTRCVPLESGLIYWTL